MVHFKALEWTLRLAFRHSEASHQMKYVGGEGLEWLVFTFFLEKYMSESENDMVLRSVDPASWQKMNVCIFFVFNFLAIICESIGQQCSLS